MPSSRARSGRQPDVELKGPPRDYAAERREKRDRFLNLHREKRQALLASMSPAARRALYYDWAFWRRESQRPPADDEWRYWLCIAGRGWGKTRVGAEYVREQAETGRAKQIGLVGRTLGEARDIMVNGPSGLLACHPPSTRPTFIESRRLLIWPNGAVGHIYTSEEPDGMRGPGLDLVWADELAAWVRLKESWTQLELMLRMRGPRGDPSRAIVTTTPRPLKTLRGLMASARARISTGSTYENQRFVDESWLAMLLETFEGTHAGKQELEALIVDDVEGALWNLKDIDRGRVHDYPELRQVLIAVDPAVTSGPDSDETGIVVVGMGIDGHIYVLEDLSGRYTPTQWGRVVCAAYQRWEADGVVGEVNNGGDLVMANVHAADPLIPFHKVSASRGKRRRAGPVSALYQKPDLKIHHVGTKLGKLEEQQTTWTGDEKEDSPDRMDALVWGVTKLALEELGRAHVGFA